MGLNYAAMDDCTRYGINHGCDENCPVLQEGRCQVPEDAIAVISDWDERVELNKLYGLVDVDEVINRKQLIDIADVI
jgi:hypothetical protein